MFTKNRILLWVFIMILAPIGFAWYVYPTLPDSIPTHFNIKGEADHWGDRSSIFFGPGIMAAASLLVFFVLTNIKKIDPKKYQVKDESIYGTFALITVAFLSLISIIIVYASTNNAISIGKLLLPTLGLFFSVMGWILPKVGQNYFAGIRLPWTLDNEDNWNETHKVAGKVWGIGGLLQAIGTLIVPDVYGFYIFISCIIVMVGIPVIFSYRMFKNGNKIN